MSASHSVANYSSAVDDEERRQVELLRSELAKTTDSREKARLRGLIQYATEESRRQHGDLTRKKMRASGVRERILNGTDRVSAPQLVALRAIWAITPPQLRQRFLAERLAEAAHGAPFDDAPRSNDQVDRL